MNSLWHLFRKSSLRDRGIDRGRRYTRDVAFQFRMGAGFLGDVNRTHPVTIEPVLLSVTNPTPTTYGQAVVVDTGDPNSGVRALASGDSALTQVYGFLVRPFPIQATPTASFGAPASLDTSSSFATPPTSGPVDIMRSGYMIGKINSGITAPKKGGTVFIWVAATSSNHVQFFLETAASSGNTVALTGAGSIATFQGPADSNGLVEFAFNI